jgi:hypothetical protein
VNEGKRYTISISSWLRDAGTEESCKLIKSSLASFSRQTTESSKAMSDRREMMAMHLQCERNWKSTRRRANRVYHDPGAGFMFASSTGNTKPRKCCAVK